MKNTDLIRKLGIKENSKILIINPTKRYPLSTSLRRSVENQAKSLDFIQLFIKSKRQLEGKFPKLRDKLAKDGAFWISWPKRSSKVKTDLNENVIREIGLKNEMVDVKVISVDKTWSGLKFVFRLKDR